MRSAGGKEAKLKWGEAGINLCDGKRRERKTEERKEGGQRERERETVGHVKGRHRRKNQTSKRPF